MPIKSVNAKPYKALPIVMGHAVLRTALESSAALMANPSSHKEVQASRGLSKPLPWAPRHDRNCNRSELAGLSSFEHRSRQRGRSEARNQGLPENSTLRKCSLMERTSYDFPACTP